MRILARLALALAAMALARKARCSRKCARPVLPAVSSREPLR